MCAECAGAGWGGVSGGCTESPDGATENLSHREVTKIKSKMLVVRMKSRAGIGTVLKVELVGIADGNNSQGDSQLITVYLRRVFLPPSTCPGTYQSMSSGLNTECPPNSTPSFTCFLTPLHSLNEYLPSKTVTRNLELNLSLLFPEW